MPHIISQNHHRAWRSFLAAQSWTTKELDSRLRKSDHVSLDVYEVLLTLEESDQHRLRMSELAETILFSRSGLTRMIDRLEELGYVRREPCPDDRRGWFAVVTEAGIQVRHGACDVVQTALKECWESALSAEEAKTLTMLMDRVSTSARQAGKSQ